MKITAYIALFLLAFATQAFASGSSEPAEGRTDQNNSETAVQGNNGEAPSVSVTEFTDQMGLFMEYPLLVANQPSKFIIHLTILEGFQPVREGKVTLTFMNETRSVLEIVETDLLREGIFTPTVELKDVESLRLNLTYEGPIARDSFVIDGFEVYSSIDAIPAQEEGETGGGISFLMEQQWKIPFATSEVETREIKRSVWAIGEVLPSPDSYVEIVSPVDGILHVGNGSQLALPGSLVKRGDVVVTITPPLQGTGYASSHLAYEQAKRDYERAQRLKDREAISEREFELVRDDYLAMKAGFEALSSGGKNGTLTLKAPISGKIVEWQARPGQRVRSGDKLMSIVDPATVWLQVNVYERDFYQLGSPVGAFVKTDGLPGGWAIPNSDMRVLTTGGALDPATRTIPVLLEVSNTNDYLRINETSPVELYSSEGSISTAVPTSALYDDNGMSVVFVQADGESFTKRIVSRGPHYAGYVAILDGLEPGERVVTTGGYHVKLASTSAKIGHGHAH
ncbi:MAG: efflux RND transporter periplasmic adaptor subunit [bacterium]